MTLAATLHLKRSFIATVTDPAAYVSAGTAGSIGGGGQRSDTFVQEGEFRIYANNVTRLVLGSGSSQALNIVFRALTPSQVARIKAMVGQTCLFRDTYGRRTYGSFLGVQMTDLPLSGKANTTLLTDVAIVFQATTFAEGV